MTSVWFGIFIVLVVEMAQITPPVGFNLFVLQGLSKRDVAWIARTAMPLFFLMIVAVLGTYFFPDVVCGCHARCSADPAAPLGEKSVQELTMKTIVLLAALAVAPVMHAQTQWTFSKSSGVAARNLAAGAHRPGTLRQAQTTSC